MVIREGKKKWRNTCSLSPSHLIVEQRIIIKMREHERKENDNNDNNQGRKEVRSSKEAEDEVVRTGSMNGRENETICKKD